jgi:protein-tyrosine phosphatase
MAAELRVLMVCMGNICRSPTAEGVLRAKLKAAGLATRVEVDSAGTTGYHSGEPPDARAIRHAAKRGYDLSRLRARRVTGEDFQRFDWLLAMDEDNLERLVEMKPDEARARVELLMPHGRRFSGTREVPDPYYGAPAGFEHVLDLVEDACDGLVVSLQNELGTSAGKA